MIGRVAWIVAVAALLVVLWIMPAVFFPHPGVNDSLEFAFLGPLLYVIAIIGALLSLVGVGPLGWKAEGPVGLGVFFFGVAAAFVLSIVTFGNFSDDRFAPLFLTPALAVPVGVALMVAALLMRSRPRGSLLMGVARGVVATTFVILWLLARGAPEWLQAPYGFDVYALITVAAVAVLVLGADVTGTKKIASR
jgi:hypothetical protein